MPVLLIFKRIQLISWGVGRDGQKMCFLYTLLKGNVHAFLHAAVDGCSAKAKWT